MLETSISAFHLPLLIPVCLINAANIVFRVKNKCAQPLALTGGQEVRAEQVEALTELYRERRWKDLNSIVLP